MSTIPSRTAVVPGLTLLIIALSFALPLPLVPESQKRAVSDLLTPEAANVYACVAWAGWAHFIFAFRGQAKTLSAQSSRSVATYIAAIAFALVCLLGIRWSIGPTIFGAIVWVYFIDHFIKAEQHFEGSVSKGAPAIARWIASYQPILSFGWLSIVLLNFGQVSSNSWVLWGISLLLAATVLIFGGWQKLLDGDYRRPLLALFFIAEALIWGAISHYMHPTFMIGIYIVHIAGGSYLHYLGSYRYAQNRSKPPDPFLAAFAIVGVNLVIGVMGYLTAHFDSFRWLNPVLGIEWFSLWVALHLIISDLFPALKSLGTLPMLGRAS
jgi:hypothetical protein